MRRLLKFLHTIGAVGLMGSMAALLVLSGYLPEPSALAEYARMRAAMGAIATWIFLPSLALTLLAGLIAITQTRAYVEATWVLAKLASGFIMFEGGLIAVQGPMQQEASLSARALAGEVEIAALGSFIDTEWQALIVLIVVATANVALGIWRPQSLWPTGQHRGTVWRSASEDGVVAQGDAGVAGDKAGVELK